MARIDLDIVATDQASGVVTIVGAQTEAAMALAQAGGAALVALLVAVALYSMLTAVQVPQAPKWGQVPPLSFAVWWVGQALAWGTLLLLAGGILGVALRGAWRLVGT